MHRFSGLALAFILILYALAHVNMALASFSINTSTAKISVTIRIWDNTGTKLFAIYQRYIDCLIDFNYSDPIIQNAGAITTRFLMETLLCNSPSEDKQPYIKQVTIQEESRDRSLYIGLGMAYKPYTIWPGESKIVDNRGNLEHAHQAFSPSSPVTLSTVFNYITIKFSNDEIYNHTQPIILYEVYIPSPGLNIQESFTYDIYTSIQPFEPPEIQEITSLKNTIAFLNNVTNHLSNNIQYWRDQAYSINNTLQNLQTQYRNLQAAYNSLTEQNNQLKATINTLKQDNQNLQKQINQLQTTIQTLQNENNTWKTIQYAIIASTIISIGVITSITLLIKKKGAKT